MSRRLHKSHENRTVTPAQSLPSTRSGAGIHKLPLPPWIPACAGMTIERHLSGSIFIGMSTLAGWTKAAGFLAAMVLLGGVAAAQDPDCAASAVGVARPEACQDTMVIFVTRAAFQGNFGGLAGADARCQEAARQAGLPGVFRAWLSTAAQPAGARLARKDAPYVLPDGTRVADNFADLTDGALAHPIDRTEYGDAVTSPFLARTATAPDGQALSPACADWTSRRRYDGGWWGATDATTPAWSRSGVFPGRCDYLAHLYCLEQ